MFILLLYFSIIKITTGGPVEICRNDTDNEDEYLKNLSKCCIFGENLISNQVKIRCNENSFPEDLSNAVNESLKLNYKIVGVVFNDINFINESIPDKYFHVFHSSLSSLEIIINQHQLILNDNSFNGLENSLENMRINYETALIPPNLKGLLPKCFNKLKKLKSFEIKWWHLTKLDENDFSELTNLEKLGYILILYFSALLIPILVYKKMSLQ